MSIAFFLLAALELILAIPAIQSGYAPISNIVLFVVFSLIGVKLELSK